MLFLCIVAAGTVGALYITDRLAASSSWQRENVFLAMLPTLLAPTIIAAALLETLDRRFGLRCAACGQSLSMGRHVTGLLKAGGRCPRCGAPAVEKIAEPGAAPNVGPPASLESPEAGGGPPSVS